MTAVVNVESGGHLYVYTSICQMAISDTCHRYKEIKGKNPRPLWRKHSEGEETVCVKP